MGNLSGGIASLGATLDEHWDAVEADFQRFYNTDLRVAVKETGSRRLYALVKNLPPDAALWRVQQTSEDNEVTRTSDPDEINRFLSDHLG